MNSRCVSTVLLRAHVILFLVSLQVNANFDVKVCDFGLSCVKEIPKPGDKLRDTAVGSPIWMAPEGSCPSF